MDNSNYKTYKKPVRMEYQDDIDIPEFREIPITSVCVSVSSRMTMPAIHGILADQRGDE